MRRSHLADVEVQAQQRKYGHYKIHKCDSDTTTDGDKEHSIEFLLRGDVNRAFWAGKIETERQWLKYIECLQHNGRPVDIQKLRDSLPKCGEQLSKRIYTLRDTKLCTKAIRVSSPLKLETRAGDSKDCIKVTAATSTSKIMMKTSV